MFLWFDEATIRKATSTREAGEQMAKASMGLARRLLVILALVLAILALVGTHVFGLGTIKELALGLGALAIAVLL